MDDLRILVQFWFDLASPVIETKKFEVCWKDFQRQLALVQIPMGEGFQAAMSAALAKPFPDAAERYSETATKKLVAACAALQEYAKAGAFFLSCRTAQKLCGFGSHLTANRRLAKLVDDGLLRVVKRGTRRRATRYMWTGGLAPVVRPSSAFESPRTAPEGQETVLGLAG